MQPCVKLHESSISFVVRAWRTAGERRERGEVRSQKPEVRGQKSEVRR